MIADNGLAQSMSRKSNCWDNAVAESFLACLKKQAIYGTRFATREQACQTVFEYIEHYYIHFAGIQTTDGSRQSNLNAYPNIL